VGANGGLWAIEEALYFLHRLVPLQLQPKPHYLSLRYTGPSDSEDHVEKFPKFLGKYQHLQIMMVDTSWRLRALNDYEVKRLSEKEEDGESFVSYYDQMKERAAS